MIVLLVFVGLVLAALGALAGAALVSVSRAELAQTVSLRLRGEAGAAAHLGGREALLTAASATTSLGVVMLGAAAAAVLAPGLGPVPVILVLLAASVVLVGGVLVGRLLPEERALQVARWVTPVLEIWAAPLWWVLPVAGPPRGDALGALKREGEAVGVREDTSLSQVERLLSFAGQPVASVMTPRTEIVAVPESASLEEIRRVFTESGFSRVPVYRTTLDDVIGTVNAFDLLKLPPGGAAPIHPVTVTPASRRCGDLLLDMQRERRHLAVVLDEFGGTLGVATLEDLLEELVGEIVDEHDRTLPERAAPGPGLMETDGATPPSAVAERFGVVLPATEAATISGLLTEAAGRIPAAGERLRLAGLEFDVVEASPTRIRRLLIRPDPVPTLTLPRERP